MATSTRAKRYRGVRQRQWGSWVSEIRHSISKKRVWLGTFQTAKEAAKAYDEAVRLMEGPLHAKTNFPLRPSMLSSSSSRAAAASLLSPSVREKLQRCNYMAALQGGARKHMKRVSSKLVNATTQASSESTLCSNLRTGAASFTKQGLHQQQAALVCLRLDNSQDQLGVTWQASTDSKPQWVTTLNVQAARHDNSLVCGGTHCNQVELSRSSCSGAPLISEEIIPSLQAHDDEPIANYSAAASVSAIISYSSCCDSELDAALSQALAANSCSTLISPSRDYHDPFHSDALAVSPASCMYPAQDDLQQAPASSYDDASSLSVLCDQLHTYPLSYSPTSQFCQDLYGQQLWQ